MPDSLKALAIVPLLIGGAIAFMILSYLLVPMLIVGFMFLVAYSLIKILKEIEEEESKKGKI